VISNKYRRGNPGGQRRREMDKHCMRALYLFYLRVTQKVAGPFGWQLSVLPLEQFLVQLFLFRIEWWREVGVLGHKRWV
jgi:hypothetical protein